MQRALDELSLHARTDNPIMLRAEIGSEVGGLARLAHDNSLRRDHPFLSLSCPAIIELPWAVLVELGHGTLFLDEVGDLAAAIQTKLVRLLDELYARGVATRLISATKHDLRSDVARGRFREDLFLRLNVVEVRIPPLRERPEDILPLAQDLIASLSADLGRRAPVLTEDAAALLLKYPWPANRRELKNAIERALLTSAVDVIGPEALPEIANANNRDACRVGDNITLRDLEWQHILYVISRTRSLKDAAAILGVDESTLWRRRKQSERKQEKEATRSKAALNGME
jgi:NtrC-family two-component system response regulator AlgB